MVVQTSFHGYVMAIERVEERLRKVTSALDEAGIAYAVVGGNAVAAWVSTRNPSAVRATRDVDLLVDRTSLDAITSVLSAIGFRREDLRSFTMFLDPEEPDRRAGVHLLWAAEKVRPSALHPAPGLDQRVRVTDRFWIATLPALLNLKLCAFRPKDQAHIIDMLELGLIDNEIRSSLPADLLARLKQVEAQVDSLDDVDAKE